jgi:phosphohistidine swiveling domain-containing protein
LFLILLKYGWHKRRGDVGVEFSTKANTLKRLEGMVTRCKILPQYCFCVEELLKNKPRIIYEIEKELGSTEKIVRSSAISEDSATASLAGKFLSVGNVKTHEQLEDAIQKVWDSFEGDNKENQIFVQPMLKDITISGVIFTIDPNTGGNYFVVNYDDQTQQTDTVTSGLGTNLKTTYVFHHAVCKNEMIQKVVDCAKELMQIFENQALDIEFAISHETIYLFQVRPLVITKEKVDVAQQKKTLDSIYQYIKKSDGNKPYLHGSRTIYATMPDWNPAEMIGLRPKPLALSLYKKLITDGIWAYQRNNYGYKNLRSFPLMVDFYGLAYIDTRVSFNSFIPRNIDDELSEKLANYYLNSLEKNPENHDKVEFEIIFSCYTFDIKDKLKNLLSYGFTEQECETLRNSLLGLTNHIIDTKDGLWIKDKERIDILEQRLQIIKESDLDIISKIYWLLEDCSRYGTLPFAGLARAGFISVLLLKSLVSLNILNQDEYNFYMNELNTVSSTITKDYSQMEKKEFLKKYGHLRPGTYDITSNRYDADMDLYFGKVFQKSEVPSSKGAFKLSLNQYRAIQDEMKQHGFTGDVLSLFEFIKAGIEGREYSKFVFTKSLSDALELIVKLGEQYGISREDMSYFDINELGRLYSSACDIEKVILHSIEEGKRKYKEALSISLPSIITDAEQVYAFDVLKNKPNYITQQSACGEIIFENLSQKTIHNKILLIPAADPGYDWIFSCNIKGFITAFGGANSHMAIRASELGIPAVIGVGESVFEQLKRANVISIDCANHKLEVLN